MSHNNEDLLNNIKRQAKRLSKKLSCPLGQAQEGLAICLYSCESYSDLIAKVKSESFDTALIVLAALSPKSELFLFKLFSNTLEGIIANFEQKFPGSNIHEEVVVALFGLGFEEFKVKVSN